ncbi:hypothetical protein I8254_15130 [Providencia rettgeri]|uniref:DUF1845 domain-containing protein n=3 Tax=Enterobacterales TaxID=91347 RepID=A0A7L8KAA3_ECOLX|nr:MULTISPECIES: hypothetical protein [Enterobacterales]MBJ9972331.1 hypothetical protein [Providencia rettgeri]QOE89717.1 hypothetical protein [Escherichia coli]BAB93780.1 hypothetical protein [Proteus vulgaris]
MADVSNQGNATPKQRSNRRGNSRSNTRPNGGANDNRIDRPPVSRGRRREEKTPFSNPEIDLKITLETQEGIRLFTRHFNPVSQALFNIMINTTRIERMGIRGAAAEAKKAIDKVIDVPVREINICIEMLTKMLEEENEIEVAEVKYTNPREFETKTRTPEATKVLRMFSSYDKAITLLDKGYLNAMAPADEVEDTKFRLTSSIQNLSATIQQLSKNAIAQLEEKGLSISREGSGIPAVVQTVSDAETTDVELEIQSNPTVVLEAEQQDKPE